MQKKLIKNFFKPWFHYNRQRSKHAKNKKDWMNSHLSEVREEQLMSGEWLENFL